MSNIEHWTSLTEAIDFAVSAVVDDEDPLNERELADGNQYVMRILRAVGETSLVSFDFERPSFLTMFESVRHLGAAGPDIDYDVAILSPGQRYVITGVRGDASYVGIVVYGASGAEGASSILASVDIDDLVDPTGAFTYEFDYPDAARVIIRQYFHDRSVESRGTWEIDRIDAPASGQSAETPLPQMAIVGHQISNGAKTLTWNAQLNRLWTPERRAYPNEFVRLAAEDIVAAVPNPDVTYAFTWWRLAADESLVIEVRPPETRYWAVQLCDRWFQSYPQRQTNLNGQQVEYRDDGTVRIVLAETDPGTANWLETSGHTTGVVFFRWLHADPETLPTCRVVPVGQLE